MNDPLGALINLLAGLTAVGLIACILTVFAKILWVAVVYIWTFGAS